MNENHEQPINATYACDFGTVSLDIPFARQPALQQFLNVPTSEKGRLVSEEFLQRFLSISECVIGQKLNTLTPKQKLKELHLGYELWKEPTSNAEEYISNPEDLLESRWVSQHQTPPQPQSETDILLLEGVDEKLMKQFKEEILRRLDSQLLSDRSFYVLIYGVSQLDSSFFSFTEKTFGRTDCSCYQNGARYTKSCRTKC